MLISKHSWKHRYQVNNIFLCLCVNVNEITVNTLYRRFVIIFCVKKKKTKQCSEPNMCPKIISENIAKNEETQQKVCKKGANETNVKFC